MAAPWENDEIISGPWDQDEIISGPWEDFQDSTAVEDGPWADFQKQDEEKSAVPVVPQKRSGVVQGARDFASGVVQGTKDIVNPIVDNARGWYGDIDKEAAKSVQRQREGSPAALEAVRAATSIGANVAGRGFRAASGIIENTLRKIPGYNQLTSKADEVTSKAIPGSVKREIPVYVEAAKSVLNEIPAPIKSSAEIVSNIPLGAVGGSGIKAIAKEGTEAVEGFGRGLRETGKTFLRSEMKIPKPVARKAYGKSLTEKQQGIVDYIEETGLHKAKNFSDMRDRAEVMIRKKQAEYESEIARISTGENAPMVNPVEIIEAKGKQLAKESTYGEADAVNGIVSKIVTQMREEGLDGPVTIQRLNEIKKRIDDGKAFQYGPGASELDNLNKETRKKLYFSVLEEMGRHSDKIRQLGKEEKKLLDIKAAADQAAYRTANRDKFSLSDKLLAAAAAPSVLIAQIASGTPGALGTAAGAVAAYGTKKVLEQGRGAGALISAGRTIEKAATKNIIPNKRMPSKNAGNGSISSPAVKPTTGTDLEEQAAQARELAKKKALEEYYRSLREGIQSTRPQVTPDQEMRSALYRYYTGGRR